MDVNTLRSIITLVCFLAFLGIVWWAYGRKRKARFDEAANLPFADDEMQQHTLEANSRSPRSSNEESDHV